MSAWSLQFEILLAICQVFGFPGLDRGHIMLEPQAMRRQPMDIFSRNAGGLQNLHLSFIVDTLQS